MKQKPRNRRLGLLIGQQATNASQATKSISDVGTGASVGATVGSVIPGIGTAIGAAVGAILGGIGSLFGPAKEGQAAMTWDDMTSHGYLFTSRGIAFDERYIGETFKGAMDENGNLWTGCGSNGYKNPDCFYSVVADTIASAFLSGAVPLSAMGSTQAPTSTATTQAVYTTAILPWLSKGASSMLNFAQLEALATQQHVPQSQQELLIIAAVDRYINGLPITRANMPSYEASWTTYAQWATPSLASQLTDLLAPAVANSPTTSNVLPVAGNTAVSAGLVSIPVVSPAVVAVAQAPISAAPNWLIIAGLAAAAYALSR